MVGGGPGAFIGGVHRMALRIDDRYELVAGAMASDPGRARTGAAAVGIAPDRAYGSFEEMVTCEKTRPDRIDAVAIVTPNFAHHAPAKAFLEAGFHVICDKPVTTSLATAIELAETVRATGMIFGLTHNYTGYPMVRQARDMVAAGELGKVRLVQVEYPQDWLTQPLERTGQKQAEWRTDPARSGPAGCLGDIGTTPTISLPSSPACNVRSWPPISRFSCRAGGSTTTSTSCCATPREHAACYGRARSRLATRTICGCASTVSRRRSSGVRKIPII